MQTPSKHSPIQLSQATTGGAAATLTAPLKLSRTWDVQATRVLLTCHQLCRIRGARQAVHWRAGALHGATCCLRPAAARHEVASKDAAVHCSRVKGVLPWVRSHSAQSRLKRERPQQGACRRHCTAGSTFGACACQEFRGCCNGHTAHRSAGGRSQPVKIQSAEEGTADSLQHDINSRHACNRHCHAAMSLVMSQAGHSWLAGQLHAGSTCSPESKAEVCA